MRTPSLWLTLALALAVAAPLHARRLMQSADQGPSPLALALRDNGLAWAEVALDRLGAPLGPADPARTFLLPLLPAGNGSEGAANRAAAYVHTMPLDALRNAVGNLVLHGAYPTKEALLAARGLTALSGAPLRLVSLPGGRLLAEISGSSYLVRPEPIFSGPQGAVYLLDPTRADPEQLIIAGDAAEGAAPKGRLLAEGAGAGNGTAGGPLVGESFADTRWCIKVRFGMPQGVRVVIRDVDNYDWADDRRPDHAIGDRVFLPGQYCFPLNTNANANPKFSVAIGEMPAAASADPGSAKWESYRNEMDTWWLRTFAVSVWQGITAWLDHSITIGFPDVPPPWPMNDKQSYNAFGPHVTVRWESGYF